MLDRKQAPETYEIDAVTLQIAQVQHLRNGARLHIIHNETQPVIRLDFVFKAGKWFEPKPGVSDLAVKMLLEGSKNYTAKQIADKVAFYGASFENNHGYDRTELTLYCLSKYLKELLPLVCDVVQNPTFPEAEFNLLKQRTSQNVKVQRQKNNYLATHAFTKQIYGDNHPYVFGYEENAFEGMSLDTLKQFYQEHFNTANLDVFVCGDVGELLETELVAALEQLDLKNPSEEQKPLAVISTKPQHEELVEIPESLQSSIRMGKRFPLHQDEDYLRLKVLNEILGGYFGSRLMRNIREDKGYTYGIHSVISPKEHDSLFYIGTDVNYAVTENTIEEIKKEIVKLQQEEVPEEELHTVKNYMLGKFVNDFITIFDQSDKYKNIVLHKLHQDYYNTYLTTIRTVTAPELQALAQQYLQLDSLHTAIAGRKKEKE
ncbi:M16 family metallopeptidase [Botryobacter ruber]|uniref:M16 family metallopeptidase n=1 Tax=Botryobacter ruber TaxID=2171629 RepID=UPI000E0BF41B|nr:pitrilysin family protein [Botryobacter ruber]